MNKRTSDTTNTSKPPASPATSRADRPRFAPHAVLWASAFVLAGLVLLQAQRVVGPVANAELVSRTGDTTIMTVSGPSDDALWVLDERSEQLFIYAPQQRGGIELVQKLSLSTMFRDARRAAGGG